MVTLVVLVFDGDGVMVALLRIVLVVVVMMMAAVFTVADDGVVTMTKRIHFEP